MGTWVVKIAKPGKSTSSTDPKDFIFNSEYSTVKIVREVESTVTVPASSSASVTIRHDLGFVPVVHLYTEPTPGSGKWRFGCPFYDTDETTLDGSPSNTYTDNINTVFTITNNTGASKVVKYHCFIFGDPL